MSNEENQSQYAAQGTIAVLGTGAASIAKKILQVMRQVGYVQKEEKNEFHGYKYASESNAIAALRPALIAAGLVMIPSVRSVRHDEHGNTHVIVEYMVLDEEGNCLTFSTSGSGNDRSSKGAIGDKGIYKALTGANKYALLKTFMLETGDDPEIPSETEKEEKKDKPAKPEGLTDSQKLFVDKLMQEADAEPTVESLQGLWAANIKKIDIIGQVDPDMHATLKSYFKNVRDRLKEAK
ncbi:hypothetical protein EBT31_04900 [bacterium]|nr:hypothetical protein [bacterium]